MQGFSTIKIHGMGLDLYTDNITRAISVAGAFLLRTINKPDIYGSHNLQKAYIFHKGHIMVVFYIDLFS